MPSFKVIPDREAWGIEDYAVQEAVRTLFSGSVMTQEYAPGDMLYASAPDTLETLEAGDPGTIMQIGADGFPDWALVLTGDYIFEGDVTFTGPVGFDGPIRIDAWSEGSIGYADAASLWTELGIGGAGQVLGVTGSLPAWQTPSTYLAHTLLDGSYHTDTIPSPPPTDGDMIYAVPGAPALWGALPVGGVGAPLVVNPAGNAPQWVPGAPFVPGALLQFNIAGTETLFSTNLSYDDTSRILSFLNGSGTVYGSDAASGTLSLRGTSNANLGRILTDAPMVTGSIEAASALSPYAHAYTGTEAYTAGFVGGGFSASPTATFTNGLFIWEGYRASPDIQSLVAPSFAAFTLMQALPVLRSGSLAGQNPLNPLIVNGGPVVQNEFVGTRTSATMIGLSWVPQVKTTLSGATMSVTNQTGVSVTPAFSTVAGSTANLGTIRGIWARNPGPALFQPAAGAENMTAYIGLDMDAIPFGGNVTKVAVRSALVAASNTRFLQNVSNAASDFGAGLIHLNDAIPLSLGGSTAIRDVDLSWNGVANALEFSFVSGNGDDLRISGPAADRFLFDSNGGNTVSEFNFNCHKFSLGAQTGAVGNQVGAFVAGTRAVAVGGEWSDFLLTQAGNITVNAAMGLVAGWTVNAPSITLGTGSVTTGCGLNVGGNPNQGTNRVGVRIISNPTGGGGINAALWVTAGLSRFDGRVDINNGIALGGGAAPTLGTIGGAGPTAAAQAVWVEIDVAGVPTWVPGWR